MSITSVISHWKNEWRLNEKQWGFLTPRVRKISILAPLNRKDV